MPFSQFRSPKWYSNSGRKEDPLATVSHSYWLDVSATALTSKSHDHNFLSREMVKKVGKNETLCGVGWKV
jgi:hypothetical protein